MQACGVPCDKKRTQITPRLPQQMLLFYRACTPISTHSSNVSRRVAPVQTSVPQQNPHKAKQARGRSRPAPPQPSSPYIRKRQPSPQRAPGLCRALGGSIWGACRYAWRSVSGTGQPPRKQAGRDGRAPKQTRAGYSPSSGTSPYTMISEALRSGRMPTAASHSAKASRARWP